MVVASFAPVSQMGAAELPCLRCERRSPWMRCSPPSQGGPPWSSGTLAIMEHAVRAPVDAKATENYGEWSPQPLFTAWYGCQACNRSASR